MLISKKKDVVPDLKNFLTLFPKRFECTMKQEQKSVTTINISRGPEQLPSVEDIKKLRNHSLSILEKARARLKLGFDYSSWINLGQAIQVLLLIFNRKRPREIAKLLLLAYQNEKEKGSQETNPELFTNLSAAAQSIVSKYMIIRALGEQNKKQVPLLLSSDLVEYIEFFIEQR